MRQTSKHVWLRGNRKLRYFPNPCEFAGSTEGGYLVERGRFRIYEDGEVIGEEPAFTNWDRADILRTFKDHGAFHVPDALA